MTTAAPRTDPLGRAIRITPSTTATIATISDSGQGGCSPGVVRAIVPPTMACKMAHDPMRTARLNRVGSGQARAVMPTPTSPATSKTAKVPARPTNDAEVTRYKAPRATNANPANAANDASVQSTKTSVTPATMPTPPVTASFHGVDADITHGPYER